MLNKLIMDCQFKTIGEEMTFSAYGNVKNVLDHARDIAVDGCYTRSIEAMKAKKRFARLLWGHDSYEPPVGKIFHMEEDSKGLFFEGKLSKTQRGNELHVLAKDEAIDSFSIGYRVNIEEYNSNENINYLKEIDVREISFVNFACNEDSLLQEMKSHMGEGEFPTTREMEKMLRANGFSRKEATAIASCYAPKTKNDLDIEEIKRHPFFQ